MTVTRRLRAHGRVQGVGFRAFVRREADGLGLDGWVRNRVDGSVEILVAGDGAVVEELVSRARRGPTFGRVDRLDVSEDVGPDELGVGFVIRGDR